MDARERYAAGDLSGAIEAMVADVKKHPSDTVMRGFLCELLCIAGELERADKQLEVVTAQSVEAAVGVTLTRQLIRAETARREFHRDGRVPSFLGEPTEELEARMQAAVHLRAGQGAEAAAALARAEELRPKPGGTMGGESFDDFRDLDDLSAGLIEVLTSTGKYFWVPLSAVRSFAPRKPERPIDLCWLPVELDVAGGPDGVVYLPTTYPPRDDDDDAARLGRITNWVAGEGDTMFGRGLRTYLVGDEDKTILELGAIEFEASEAQA